MRRDSTAFFPQPVTILHDFSIRTRKTILGKFRNVLMIQVSHAFYFWRHIDMRRQPYVTMS